MLNNDYSLAPERNISEEDYLGRASTTNQAFNIAVCKKLDQIKELFVMKNNQYATNTDPIANFSTGAMLLLGKDDMPARFETLKAYVSKHIAHVYNNELDGSKMPESIDDIICYFAIAAVMASQNLDREALK